MRYVTPLLVVASLSWAIQATLEPGYVVPDVTDGGPGLIFNTLHQTLLISGALRTKLHLFFQGALCPWVSEIIQYNVENSTGRQAFKGMSNEECMNVQKMHEA